MNLFNLRRNPPSLDDLAVDDHLPSKGDNLSSECLMPSVDRPKQIFVRGQGWQQAFAAAFEQAHIEVLFEVANLLGQRRLGD